MVNKNYVIFMGRYTKALLSISIKERDEYLEICKLSILGNMREARYFHLGEDFMRRFVWNDKLFPAAPFHRGH